MTNIPDLIQNGGLCCVCCCAEDATMFVSEVVRTCEVDNHETWCDEAENTEFFNGVFSRHSPVAIILTTDDFTKFSIGHEWDLSWLQSIVPYSRYSFVYFDDLDFNIADYGDLDPDDIPLCFLFGGDETDV